MGAFHAFEAENERRVASVVLVNGQDGVRSLSWALSKSGDQRKAH